MASAGAGAAVSELPRRLDHAWRVFGTGLSFVAFGLGGLLLGVLVMPPAACPGSRRACSAGPPTSPYGAASTSPRCGSPAARQP